MKFGKKVTMTAEAFQKLIDRIDRYKIREKSYLKAIEYYEKVINKLNKRR